MAARALLRRSLVRAVAALAAPRRLSILIYHRVLEKPDPLRLDDIDVSTFQWHVELLASCFNVLDLPDAVRGLAEGTLPPRAVCITFDDGYADNAELALPLLSRYGLPATFFIATGYLDGGRMFNDSIIEAVRGCRRAELDLEDAGLGRHPLGDVRSRRVAIKTLICRLKHLQPAARDAGVEAIVAAAGCRLPDDLMMHSDQVIRLARTGMAIGGHTVTHPILASVPPAVAREEIEKGRAQLAALTGRPVALFAYPNGKPGDDYGPGHVSMVREMGFDAAVSTARGSAGPESGHFELPRFTPWDRHPERFAVRLLGNFRRRHAPRAESRLSQATA